MAFKLGKVADMGVLAGGLAAMAGGPMSLLALPAFLKGYADDQEEQDRIDKARYATNALMTGQLPAAEDPNTGITWNQSRPVDTGGQEAVNYAAQSPVFAPELAKRRIDQMMPAPETFSEKPEEGLGPDGKPAFLQFGSRGGQRFVQNFTPLPKAQDVGGMITLVDRNGKEFPVNEKSPEAQRMAASGQYRVKEKDTPAMRPWRPLSPQEAQGLGITQGGPSYITNGIDVKPIEGTAPRPNLQWNADHTAQVPVQGSEADPAVAEAKRINGLRVAMPDAQSALKNTMSGIDQTTALIDDILSPKNDTGLGDVTGFGGTGLGDALTFGGTEGANVRAKIKQLESRTMLGALSDLKANSPTGASGLGALSEKEGEALRNAAAALDRSQDMTSYTNALKNYKLSLQGTKDRLSQAFQKEFAPVMGGSSAPAAAVAFLKANPGYSKQFEDKYGPGSAAKALGR